MMDGSEKGKVLDANRRFHEELVTRGLYAEQPFLNDRNRRRVRRIVQNLSAKAGNDALIDIGCGTGFILGLAYGFFRRIAGVDISPKMMEQIHFPDADLRLAPAEALPFPDASFNVATLHGVLHHFHDVLPPFHEIFRSLKPGGAFYADESPNAYCLRALRSVDTDAPGAGDLLRGVASAVQGDVSAYESKYGLDPEVVRMAMYRDKVLGGIVEEEVIEALRAAGFSRIDYRYRWFLGQGKVLGDGYDVESERFEDYLRSLLPLTRPMFKYVSFTAWKE